MKKASRAERLVALLCLVVALIVIGAAHEHHLATPTEGGDIYFSWLEGKRIFAGSNPYARVLAGDFLHNDKYATHLPLFYVTGGISHLAGLERFPEWIHFWRIVFAGVALALGAFLFWIPWSRGHALLAGFTALFFAGSRWTVFVTFVAQVDFLPIACLVGSLYLLPRYPRAAWLAFGLSLAIKQIAIFVLPLFLVWAWQTAGQRRARGVLRSLAWIALIPILVSVPFIVWGPEAFLRSILFSATRLPAGQLNAQSLDAMLGLVGLPAKVPMLALMALVYALAFFRRATRYQTVLLVLATFVGFNSVLYLHYPAWVVPFLPLAMMRDDTEPSC